MQPPPLTALDLAVAVVVGLSAIVALARGALRELLGLLAWIGAFACAWFGFSPVRPILKEAIGNDLLVDLATVVVVFLVPLVALKLLAGAVARAANGPGPADRLLGLLFGLARGALLVVLGWILATMLVPAERHPDWVKRAVALPWIKGGALWVEAFLPAELEAKVKAATGAAHRPDAGKGYAPEQRRELERLLPRS
ncbi:MAG: CvpA family protein [Geminicoccaceae bacterium]|nr:CvpA family protein [Geminicoccaceae bacterium]MDW8125176.1 CvpA family protein [Geminicoccaceae bacterium]